MYKLAKLVVATLFVVSYKLNSNFISVPSIKDFDGIVENTKVSLDVYLMRLKGDLSSIKNSGEFVEIKALTKLTKIFNETEDLVEFIKKVVNNYEIQIDHLIAKKYKEIKNEMFEEQRNKRPLFTEETTKRIIGNIEKQKITNQEVV